MNDHNLIPRQKGQGPLPGAGRPKGSLDVKTIVRRLLASKEEILHPLTKKKVKATQLEIIAIKQLESARKGNLPAFNALLDRLEGKPDENIKHALSGSVAFVYAESAGNDPILDEQPEQVGPSVETRDASEDE